MTRQTTTQTGKIGYWVITILVALPFAIFGGMKVIGVDTMLNRMAEIHYAPAITWLIGTIELIAVIGLFLPKFRLVSLFTYLLIMAGAVGSHIAAGHALNSVIMPFLIAILVLIGIVQTLKLQNLQVLPPEFLSSGSDEYLEQQERV